MASRAAEYGQAAFLLVLADVQRILQQLDARVDHDRFPLPIPLRQAGEGGKVSLRDFHLKAAALRL
jgi:hypothetical protein